MRIVYALAGVVACGALVSAQISLPTGVVRVTFGAAERTRNAAGTESCRIPRPLPSPPVIGRGVSDITYAVELEPRIVKSAQAQLVAPGAQGEIKAAPCNVFTLVPRGFSQTQLGNTISRVDGKPLMPGVYKVRLTIDGQTAEIPFVIK